MQSKKPFLLTQGGGFDDAYDDILRVVRTGMQWRYLRPTAAVAYITVFKTMHKWIDAGLFHTAYARLLRLYRRHRRPRYSCVDSTFVKNVYGVTVLGVTRPTEGAWPPSSPLPSTMKVLASLYARQPVGHAPSAADARSRHCSHSVLATTPIDLPEKVPFDLRQQETAQLETHTIEHLETFPARLLHVMRVRIAEAMPHLKWSAIEALGKRAATYALSCPTHLSTAESAIQTNLH